MLISEIAKNGTDAEVNALYLSIFGKNISGCIPCQKKDARIELAIFAKNNPEYIMAEPTITTKYILKEKYKAVTRIGYFNVYPWDDAKVEKFKERDKYFELAKSETPEPTKNKKQIVPETPSDNVTV